MAGIHLLDALHFAAFGFEVFFDAVDDFFVRRLPCL